MSELIKLEKPIIKNIIPKIIDTIEASIFNSFLNLINEVESIGINIKDVII